MSDDLTSLFQADAEEKQKSAFEGLNDTGLFVIARLAKNIQNVEENLAVSENLVKQYKKELQKLTDEELPQYLAEMGLSSIKLEDGSKIDVKKTYGGSIKKDNEQEAFAWLRQNGYGDIVKNIVSVDFAMGEDTKAKEFQSLALKSGLNPNQVEKVHPQTLKAFIKERVEQGDEFPMELFGAFIGQKATITKGGSK
tara:strand:+ start:3783 stop:4370 length:588 start_codon:yes stop_codon:yes gene_type:complete